MPNWIFQANPQRYDLLAVLRRGKPVKAWSVKRHLAQLEPGDCAALWISGKGAGIYAIGSVSGKPFRGRADNDWKRKEDRNQPMTFCPLTLSKVLVNAPILKADLILDARFKYARIVTQPQATNPFLTTDAEWEAIVSRLQPESELEAGRNPSWAQDELILALDLYFRRGLVPASDPEVIELSNLLNRLPIHPFRPDSEHFRNANGVALKLANFAALDPNYPGKGMSAGGKRDAEVFARFHDSHKELGAIARQIRRLAVSGAAFPLATEEDEEEAEEGRLLYRRHRTVERDRRIVMRKKASVLKSGAQLACEVCAFIFAKEYGELGMDFIECHHRAPLSKIGLTTTRLSDLALVCSNCHSMIHHRKPWPSIDELRKLREAARPAK